MVDVNRVNEFCTIAVDPADPERRTLYAGDYTLGLFVSRDCGVTWDPVNEGLNAVVVYDLAVIPGTETLPGGHRFRHL